MATLEMIDAAMAQKVRIAPFTALQKCIKSFTLLLAMIKSKETDESKFESEIIRFEMLLEEYKYQIRLSKSSSDTADKQVEEYKQLRASKAKQIEEVKKNIEQLVQNLDEERIKKARNEEYIAIGKKVNDFKKRRRLNDDIAAEELEIRALQAETARVEARLPRWRGAFAAFAAAARTLKGLIENPPPLHAEEDNDEKNVLQGEADEDGDEEEDENVAAEVAV